MPPFYVVNLKQKKERWDFIRRQHEEVGGSDNFPLIRIEAVDCASLIGTAGIPCVYMFRDMTKGEQALMESDKKVLQRIAEGSDPFALLLEDDAAYSSALIDFVHSLTKSDFSFDIIHLEEVGKGKDYFYTNKGESLQVGKVGLAPMLSPTICMAALVISKEGAKKILSLLDEIDAPIDEYLFNIYSKPFRNLKIFQVQKILVWQLTSLPLQLNLNLSSSLSEGRIQNKENKFSPSIGLKKLLLKISYLTNLFFTNKERVLTDESEKEIITKTTRRLLKTVPADN